jgi:hypothetical protein
VGRKRPSSIIRGFRYDASKRQMVIIFMTGNVYVYDRVPPEVRAGLENADSQGVFFNEVIRDHFPCRRVRPAA